MIKCILKSSFLTVENEPIQPVESSVLQMRITEMCEILLKEYTEAQEYAEKCRKANEALEKQVFL
jgi:hypothetical protein